MATSQVKALYLRVPYSLKRQIKKRAKEQGITINAWMIKCMEHHLPPLPTTQEKPMSKLMISDDNVLFKKRVGGKKIVVGDYEVWQESDLEAVLVEDLQVGDMVVRVDDVDNDHLHPVFVYRVLSESEMHEQLKIPMVKVEIVETEGYPAQIRKQLLNKVIAEVNNFLAGCDHSHLARDLNERIRKV